MEHPTPQETLETALAQNEALRDLVSTLWLYTNRHTWTQLTTEQKELYADVVDAEHRAQDEAEGLTGDERAYTPLERWWRDEEREVPLLLALRRSTLDPAYAALVRDVENQLVAAGLEADEHTRGVAQVAVRAVLGSPHLPGAQQ